MPPSRSFCSRRARASDVALHGTATEAHLWLLLEVPAPWGRKALDESELPPEVKSYLANWEAAANGRRVQFIRRETKRFDRPGRMRVFIASVREPVADAETAGADVATSDLYQGSLDAYADLLKAPYARWLHADQALVEGRQGGGLGREQVGDDGAAAWPEMSVVDGLERRAEPLFLTCTNGRRDACCAKWGRPMAHAMADAAGEAAWQTSHLGGHRFAPTLLVLPHASQYGWLEPEEAAPLVRAHRRGHLYRLDRFRGHTGLPRPVQAAAAFLRERLDARALDALAPVELVRCGEDDRSIWRVRFRVGEGLYDVRVAREEGERLPASCDAAPEVATRFVLRAYGLVQDA